VARGEYGGAAYEHAGTKLVRTQPDSDHRTIRGINDATFDRRLNKTHTVPATTGQRDEKPRNAANH
jgi:hypothetical protein